MLTLIACLFFVFLFINVPVAFSLALATLPLFLLSNYLPMTTALQRMYGATQSFPLLAVPFFILAGNLMNSTGITHRMLEFSRLLTGWMAGGLAQVSIVLSALMGGISGSAVADAAMEARLLGPSMAQRGYAPGFSAAVIAFSSVITATIPPSIGLILFGFVAEVSIGRLLLGGVLPGILMTAILMMITWLIARNRGYQPELTKLPTTREVLRSFVRCFWALMFPILLLVGFRFGLFTATEAGAVVVVYALLVGTLAHRELTWPSFTAAVRDSLQDLGMVMLIIIMAAVLGYAITIEQAPRAISDFLTGVAGDKYVVLLIVIGIMLVAGMVMEATVNILLVTPLVLPALVHAGFDPIHVGVILVILVTLGGNTPPVGVIMYTVCGIMKVSFGDFVRWSLPFLVAMIILVACLVAFPDIVLFLPKVAMG